MKYSLITLSLLASISFAEFINPLPADSRAKDNGGFKNSIEAYTDGIGVQVIDNKYATELNQQHSLKDLIFKYGEKAKTNGNSVVDYVSLAPESTTEEKTIAQEIKSLSWTGPIDGTSCDDNNPLTTGETYLNGVCQGGTILDGTSCDDGNALTVGESFLNGICQGGIIGSIAGNGLIYDNFQGGSKTFENAKLYCESKGMRLPTLNETTAGSSGVNGVPTPYAWTWTSSTYSGFNVVFFSNVVAYHPSYNSYYVRCVK